MKFPFVLTLALSFAAASLHAQTWNIAGGGSWNDPANWNPQNVPNAIDANATIDNTAATANRTITLDGAKTVGSITFNQTTANAFTNSVTTGTGGPLTFDVSSSTATITTNGTGTGNNTIS